MSTSIRSSELRRRAAALPGTTSTRHASATASRRPAARSARPAELRCFIVIGRDRPTGEHFVAIYVCWTGSAEGARTRLEALRAIPGLSLDAVRPMSYLQIQSVFGEIPFGLRHYWKGHFVSRL